MEDVPSPQTGNDKKNPLVKYLLIFLLIFLILGAGIYYFFFFGKESPTTPTTSNDQTTKSEDKTADWVTYEGTSSGIKFRLKHPTNLQKNEISLAPDLVIISNKPITSSDYADGDLILNILVSETVSLKDVNQQDSTFAGLPAKKATDVLKGAGVIAYYINNQPPVGSKHFTFDCRYYPPSDTSLAEICELMAKSFNFLP